MTFKTSHSVPKRKGRWSKKGKKAVKVWSCKFCFQRQSKAKFCSNCMTNRSVAEPLVQITVYVPKRRS